MSDIRRQPAIRGIKYSRDAEDEKFVAFFDIVQSAAKGIGKVFFLWAGEGHDITTSELDGEDLSGWLVDEEDADRFEAIWLEPNGVIPEELDEAFSIAIWSRTESGELRIDFE